MRKKSLWCLLILSVTSLGSVVHAMGPMLDAFPNFVGGGLGVTSDYSGSDDMMLGALPGARYQFENSNRFAEWYGPSGDINLLDSPAWQLGPALGLRMGRSSVDDVVVAKMPEIGITVEAGLMASWTKTSLGAVPWRFRVGVMALTDMGNKYEGLNSSLFTGFWMPLSPRVILGLGGGASWASASYNQTYYGVSPSASAASGLPVYLPNAGLRQWYA